MSARDASIDSGLSNSEQRTLARPWRVIDSSPDLSPEETARADFARSQLDRLRGGLPRVAATVLRYRRQYGFCLGERVWELDAAGRWVLADLVWIEPWQVQRWITDEMGFARFVEIRSAAGEQLLPFEKFLHCARQFTGRNYEGIAALRPLWWPSEAKRRGLVRGERAKNRFGIGTRKWKVDADAKDANVRGIIDTIEDDFHRHDQERMILFEGFDYEMEQTASVWPDNLDDIRFYNHEVARQLGDTLSEEGQSIQGARAVGVEKRKAADTADEGEAKEIANELTTQLIHSIYQANGFSTDSAPRVHVSGFADVNKWRAALELVREDTSRLGVEGAAPLLDEMDINALRRQARLDFGWGL